MTYMAPDAPATTQFVDALHAAGDVILDALDAEANEDGRLFGLEDRFPAARTITDAQMLKWAEEVVQTPVTNKADRVAVLLEIAHMTLMAAADAAQGKDL